MTSVDDQGGRGVPAPSINYVSRCSANSLDYFPGVSSPKHTLRDT